MTEPRSSTDTLITALMILSRDIETEDGVANAALAEAAMRLGELRALVVLALPIVKKQEWRDGVLADRVGSAALSARMQAEVDAC